MLDVLVHPCPYFNGGSTKCAAVKVMALIYIYTYIFIYTLIYVVFEVNNEI